MIKEKLMHAAFFIAACTSILAVALICLFLFANGIPAIQEIGVFNRFRKNIPKFSFPIYYVSKLLFIMQRCYIFFMVLMCPLRLCIVCIIKQKSKEKEYETGSDR